MQVLWERTHEAGRWAGGNRRPAYQFPFQLLGWFLGSTLTVQHQWLPNLGCEVSTAYCCLWKTAQRWRGRKGDGADKTSTGYVREPEEWYPGSRKVLGDLGRGQSTFRREDRCGESGSPHRLKTSTQAPTVAPVAILLSSQAPAFVCPSLLWPPP